MKFCVGVVLHPSYRHNISRLDLVLFLFQDFYHIRINFRTHDKYSLAESTLVITYTLIARGGGEVWGLKWAKADTSKKCLKLSLQNATLPSCPRKMLKNNLARYWLFWFCNRVSDMGLKFGHLHATKGLALMFSLGVCQGLIF